MGFEPTTSELEVQRAIRCATAAMTREKRKISGDPWIQTKYRSSLWQNKSRRAQLVHRAKPFGWSQSRLRTPTLPVKPCWWTIYTLTFDNRGANEGLSSCRIVWTPLMGFEPTTSELEVQRAIRCATAAMTREKRKISGDPWIQTKYRSSLWQNKSRRAQLVHRAKPFGRSQSRLRTPTLPVKPCWWTIYTLTFDNRGANEGLSSCRIVWTPLMGFEPTTSELEVQRAIRCATAAMTREKRKISGDPWIQTKYRSSLWQNKSRRAQLVHRAKPFGRSQSRLRTPTLPVKPCWWTIYTLTFDNRGANEGLSSCRIVWTPLMGFEPTTSELEVQRAIRCATAAMTREKRKISGHPWIQTKYRSSLWQNKSRRAQLVHRAKPFGRSQSRLRTPTLPVKPCWWTIYTLTFDNRGANEGLSSCRIVWTPLMGFEPTTSELEVQRAIRCATAAMTREKRKISGDPWIQTKYRSSLWQNKSRRAQLVHRAKPFGWSQSRLRTPTLPVKPCWWTIYTLTFDNRGANEGLSSCRIVWTPLMGFEPTTSELEVQRAIRCATAAMTREKRKISGDPWIQTKYRSSLWQNKSRRAQLVHRAKPFGWSQSRLRTPTLPVKPCWWTIYTLTFDNRGANEGLSSCRIVWTPLMGFEPTTSELEVQRAIRCATAAMTREKRKISGDPWIQTKYRSSLWQNKSRRAQLVHRAKPFGRSQSRLRTPTLPVKPCWWTIYTLTFDNRGANEGLSSCRIVWTPLMGFEPTTSELEVQRAIRCATAAMTREKRKISGDPWIQTKYRSSLWQNKSRRAQLVHRAKPFGWSQSRLRTPTLPVKPCWWTIYTLTFDNRGANEGLSSCRIVWTPLMGFEPTTSELEVQRAIRCATAAMTREKRKISGDPWIQTKYRSSLWQNKSRRAQLVHRAKPFGWSQSRLRTPTLPVKPCWWTIYTLTFDNRGANEGLSSCRIVWTPLMGFEPTTSELEVQRAIRCATAAMTREKRKISGDPWIQTKYRSSLWQNKSRRAQLVHRAKPFGWSQSRLRTPTLPVKPCWWTIYTLTFDNRGANEGLSSCRIVWTPLMGFEPTTSELEVQRAIRCATAAMTREKRKISGDPWIQTKYRSSLWQNKSRRDEHNLSTVPSPSVGPRVDYERLLCPSSRADELSTR